MTDTRVFFPTPTNAVRRWLDRIPRMTGDWQDHADMQIDIGQEIAEREGPFDIDFYDGTEGS